MCLLAILYRVIDDAPVVLAANREEAYARGGTPLDLRQAPLPFIAGLDPVAGGTWLGINLHRLVVAVTNRPKSVVPGSPRSRGLLVKDLLTLRSAREAAHIAAKELGTNAYAGCNIVCADAESLWVVNGGDWLRMHSLTPGYHFLTNGDINDALDDRIYWSMERIHEAVPRTVEGALSILQFVAGHDQVARNGPERGTIASTLLALAEAPRQSRLLHANGPPGRTPFADRTDLLWELEKLAEAGQP